MLLSGFHMTLKVKYGEKSYERTPFDVTRRGCTVNEDERSQSQRLCVIVIFRFLSLNPDDFRKSSSQKAKPSSRSMNGFVSPGSSPSKEVYCCIYLNRTLLRDSELKVRSRKSFILSVTAGMNLK